MSIRFSICHTGSLSISPISLLFWFDLIPEWEMGVKGTYEFNGQWDYYQLTSWSGGRDLLSPKALFIPTKIFPNRP
jgi:hypothetical protein